MKPRSDYLSASRIKTLRSCPMKFYLQYVAPDKPDMPNNWGAANGTLVHEVFEDYASGERRDWKHNLMEKFRAYMADQEVLDYVFKFTKGVKTSVTDNIKATKRSCHACPFAKMMADGQTVHCSAVGKTTTEFVGSPRKMLEDTISLANAIFDDDFNPIDEMKVIGIEQKFDITFPNGVRTYGFIDLVSEVSEDTIEIRDYKSAKRVPSDKEIEQDKMRYDIQMQMYYAVAKYMCDNNIAPFKDTYKNIFVTIHFLRKCPITMVYNDVDYRRILNTIEKEKNKILTIENPEPLGMVGRDRFWICNYCNIDACNKACLEIHGKSREQLKNEYEQRAT